MGNPNVQPLAQDHVVAARVPDPETFFFHDPNLARLPDGRFLIAAPQWPRTMAGPGTKPRTLRMLRSEDGGRSWEELPPLPYEEGTPFVLDDQLLMFVQEKSHRDFQVVASENAGEDWSKPRTVLEAPLWNISTGRVSGPEALYWAMDHDLPGAPHGGKAMVRLDRTRDPRDPGAWSLSNVVGPPDLPKILMRNLYKPQFRWLEPNTVRVGDRIRVFTRCIIDKYATANMAGVLDYDAGAHRLEFTQLTAWPGAQCKFFVVHDAPHALYWMLSNLVTNSQDLLGWSEQMRASGFRSGPGNERRWLFLHYGIDCLNWFPAGCVARWPQSVLRSFMYPSAVIDGEDLVVLSRTSDAARDQHDADTCTVHRVRGFRRLALDLHAGGFHPHPAHTGSPEPIA